MTASPLPPLPNLRGGIVKHTILGELYDRLQVEQRMVAYATQARADLEAEVARLREVLQNLLNDTQHAEHPDCDDGPCPVREARAALESKP